MAVESIDWLGIILTLLIIIFIILLVWSKMQGDTIIEILGEIRDFLKGDK